MALDILKTGIKQKDAKYAIGEEQSHRQAAHVLWLEQVKRQQWLLGNPALNVHCGSQQQHAQHKRDENVGRPPAIRGVGTVGDGEGGQDQARHNGYGAPIVHLDMGVLNVRLGPVAGNGDESRERHDKGDDAAQPKVPAPRHVLGGGAAGDDAQEEANGGKGAPEAEDEVLTRARAVRLAHQHDARRKEGCGSQAAQGAGDDEHLVVGAEARDEGPDGEPEEAGVEDEVGAVDVGEAAKGEEKGARDEGEDARGPGLGALGDVEGLGDVGQDDIEARDEELGHEHGDEQGAAEKHLV